MGKLLNSIIETIKIIPKALASGFGGVIGAFQTIGKDFIHGNVFVKLSALWMGAGYMRYRQYMKAILMTVFQGAFIYYTIQVGIPYLSKFSTLGTHVSERVYSSELKAMIVTEGDNSFKILLFSLVSLVIILAAIVIYLKNIHHVRQLELLAKEGKHINTFREDIKLMMNQKFHKTLLTLPIMGVVIFTIIPILVMVLIAFTNYDKTHIVPENLFTWVGFKNFGQLFGSGLTGTFGYSFWKVLAWTFIWAFFATGTTYIGGVLLSLFINNKKTHGKKLWRTIFIVTIAVPQFVSLLVVRNFFSNQGIVNTICSNLGITDLLHNIGWISGNYIPFLSQNGWAHVMIILINIWIGVPYLMLIATGVLMNIPVDLYESARIDGARPGQIFRKITMPYMLFVTGPYLITSFIANINNFNVIYLLTQDVYTTLDQKLANSSAKEVDLLVTWLYRLTQDQYNYKMASVIGIMVFIVSALFTLVAFNITIKGDKEEKFQ